MIQIDRELRTEINKLKHFILFKDMSKIAEMFIWFKGLNILSLIIYIAGLVVTVVGALGFFIWYWIWYSHYSFFWEEDKAIYNTLDDDGKSFLDCILTGAILGLIIIVAGIAAFFLWFFLSSGLIWKICLLVAVAISIAAVICGFIAASKTPTSDEDFKNPTRSTVMCVALEVEDIVHEIAGSFRFPDDWSKYDKYCSSSNGPNISMCIILLVGIILDFVAFFLTR